MIRQYHASRRRGGYNPLGVGVIAVGSIYYLQDDRYWRGGFRSRTVCRNPSIVQAFANGTVAAARRNPLTGQWEERYVSGRSHMALVQSLRDGRMKTLPVRILVLHDDLCLWKAPTDYPRLPKLAEQSHIAGGYKFAARLSRRLGNQLIFCRNT